MKHEERENLELVFIAACQSEFVADIFITKGAKYCICVEEKGSVLDEVMIDFVPNFYKQILAGASIPKAFDYAKRQTKSFLEKKDKKESDIIKLKQRNVSEKESESIFQIKPIEGLFECNSEAI